MNLNPDDEIALINEEFAKAWGRRDLAAILSYFDHDAYLMFAGRLPVHGIEAIEAYFRSALEKPTGAVRFESIECFADGSTVVDVGYTFGADPASPGATLAYPSMKYVVVYKRQPDGSLKLLVDTSNGMPAPTTGVDSP